MKTSAPQLVRYLFLFTAAVLIVFGIGSFVRIGENPSQIALYAFYALAMFGDAAFMLVFAFFLQRKKKQIYRLAVTILALNILLTIFDQFGFVDLLFVLLNIVILIFLLAARKEFSPV